MSKGTLPGWSVSCPGIWFDNKLGIYFVAYNMLSRAPSYALENGQRQHVHPRDSCLQWLQDSIRSSESPECRRSFWCKSIWFENNCTVCGRGAPVQGAETLRQKKCNEYTWFYHKKNKNESFDILKGQSKTKVSSSHLTQPQAIHILSLLNNQLFIQRTWRWSQLCLKHVVRYWRVWGYAFVPAASLGQISRSQVVGEPPTHLKNMLVKMASSSPIRRGESKIVETTT